MAIKPIKVSQLNNYIGRILGTDPLIGNVSVIGEIANLNFHNSGHIYFSLKDENSTVRCFLPFSYAEKLRYEMAEGMEVTVAGYVSVYERGGYYSLNVKDLEVSGKGSLAIAFEKIKQKLEDEGMFLPENKKELPFFPSKIALVTSETGAAVQDMLKIIQSRNKIVDVLVYPTLVQGAYAAEDIARAIEDINSNFKDVDVMIVGRGGGSAEDLWAFNEEKVARAIFNSKIPVISAVGHETDVTISDFVADKRAETPTAAAVMAVPDIEELREYIKSLQVTAFRYLTNYTERNRSRLGILKAKLDSLNPLRIINSGYGAVLDEKGNWVTSVKNIQKGSKLKILLADGEIEVDVKKVKEVSYE